jgi:tetratricopeptide (TPR) repeat protein
MGGEVYAQAAADSISDPPWMTKEQSIHKRQANQTQTGPDWGWTPTTMTNIVPRRSASAGTDSATVSLQELKHQVPGKAAKEYRNAHKSFLAGDLSQAIEHFKKAIAIDPEFMDAHNDLAAVYLRRVEPDLALGSLETAIKLDPQSHVVYSNVAIAYLMKSQLGDAEIAARRTVNLDRVGNRSRLILGLVLVMQDKFTDEAAHLLDQAQAEYPQAMLLLGRLIAARGDIDGAKAKLREYLAKRTDGPGRELATEWLNTLNKVQASNASAQQASAVR